jgi:hypothetical protein
MNNKTSSQIVGFILGALLVAAALPLITIWSLNTVFDLNIAYGIKEWFATAILMQFFGIGRYAKQMQNSNPADDVVVQPPTNVNGLTKH